MVSVNRVFMIIGILGLLGMVAYFYWDKTHSGRQRSSMQQTLP